MGILISTGFMGDIPYDLDEAAFLDGCGVWGIFFRVIAPLMVPAVSTVGIYTFLQCWNELMFANIFISKEALKTLPVGIQGLGGQYSTEWGPSAPPGDCHHSDADRLHLPEQTDSGKLYCRRGQGLIGIRQREFLRRSRFFTSEGEYTPCIHAVSGSQRSCFDSTL